MRIILVLILSIIALNAAFSVNIPKEEDESTINKPSEPVRSKRPPKRAYVRPKREQIKTKIMVQKSLNKNKIDFKNRINNELRLLNEEYEVLEYNP